MCGGGGSDRSGRNGFLICVLLRVVVPVCVDLCNSWFCDCRSHCSDYVKVAWCRGCMRNIIFCKWQIYKILEWLHEGCDCDLSADFSILALVIFLVKFLLKNISKYFFLLWYRDPSGFGATIPIIIMYKKNSLCNSFFCKSLLCVKDSLCVIFFRYKSFWIYKYFLCVKIFYIKVFCV